MSAISGQKSVAAAGTEVPLGTARINGPLLVRANSANAGVVYLGNDGAGAVSSTTGIILPASGEVYFKFVGSLASLMLDAAQNNDGVSWIALDV